MAGFRGSCDFVESEYAKLFRTTVISYLERGPIPGHLLPYSLAELSAGLLLVDDDDVPYDPWRAIPPRHPDFGDARRSLRVRKNHLQDIVSVLLVF